jgi:hypothetical protein
LPVVRYEEGHVVACEYWSKPLLTGFCTHIVIGQRTEQSGLKSRHKTWECVSAAVSVLAEVIRLNGPEGLEA